MEEREGREGRRPIRELAVGGVLLNSRALECGWPRRGLTRALRAQGWTPIRAGAWAEPGRTPDLVTRLRAVQLVKPRLVVSHRSAAALWLIEVLAPGPGGEPALEFTDPALTLRREGHGVRVHRVRLAPEEVAERHGLRVTDAVRTLADLLRTEPRDAALVALESALGQRRVGPVRRAPLTSLDAITAVLARPFPGAARARRWLRLCDPHAGSPAETIARLRMLDAGLRPETQVELLTPDGHRVIPDFLFRGKGLAVEIEGYAYHGTRDSHRRDVTRFNRIQGCPEVRRVLRYTAEEVFYRPAMVVEEIGRVLSGMPAME
ncbi:endonuclease domain-containing protein [Streptomyces bobili]|uniref:hypothetical protein n=1 Tax=Streptomyces bobili TaxID=67280 RepID=UPI00225063E3|nr:hypothetical protein [Streptomyces bobili]MCX5524758.1 endonuclease domain-containing protein [Streptomyces bobili]